MRKILFVAIGGFISLATGILQYCVQPPDFPDEPVIKFKNLSKAIMKQTPLGADSVLVTFSFTDGNGDLGAVNGEPNIFIEDGRDGFPKPPYQIPYIEQRGAGNGISGEISIIVPTSCCIQPIFQNVRVCDDVDILFDTLFYRISIKDQAGHISNKIETPLIGLICK